MKLTQKLQELFPEFQTYKQLELELYKEDRSFVIERLLSVPELKAHFFYKASGCLVFDAQKLMDFTRQKEVFASSYTKYKNKITLASGGKSIAKELGHVVLNFPFKECILEGGMSTEDKKRSEIFYNETLAPEEITRLFEPKALTNFQSYGDRTGKINHETDNLLIKGNNLLALYSLLPKYRGKVKLIYIDPPYNTGNDGFKYNDAFNHSTWLVFMKNRLEIAKALLAEDGSIYVQLDYNEVHYCKVLMDEIFGKENLVREIIWFKGNTFGYAASANNFVLSHDTILFYSKKCGKYQFNKLYEPYSDEYIKQRFTQDDNDGRGKYRIQGQNQRQYLNESRGIPIPDVWQIPVVNVMALERCFDNQKPEQILERIISASTKPNDLVLDFFGGSGTTAAVAHKMGRRWITIEQMDYVETITRVRLEKVLEGEQGGISKNHKWQGGGGFAYFELFEWNKKFEEMIKNASIENLVLVYNQIKEQAFWRYDLDINNGEFKALTLNEQKQLMVEMLNKNHLYCNIGEIEDATYGISKEDLEFNKEFYE